MLAMLLIDMIIFSFNVFQAKAESKIVVDGKINDWITLDLTPLGTDVEGNIRVYNPIATDLLELWGYLDSENLYLAIKVSLYYSFEYYEGWVRYNVLFDVSYENESEDFGMGEYLLVWFGIPNVGLFEWYEGNYIRIATLGWDEQAYGNSTGYMEFKIPLSHFWYKGNGITQIKIRVESYDEEHKETVNSIGDYVVYLSGSEENGIPIGEWFSDDRIAICIHSFQTASRIDYFPYEPDTPGYIWAWVDVSIKNVGTEEVSTNSLYAHLKDNQGYMYEGRPVANDPKHLKLIDLPPGEIIRGIVYFEIPPDATIVAFIWYDHDSYIEIPEFSSLMVLSLVTMIVSIVAVIARKKVRSSVNCLRTLYQQT